MKFSELEKEALQAQVPTEVRDAIGDIANLERRSLSEVTTKLLCDALRMEPGQFGIAPFRRTPRTQTPAAATA